MTVRAAAKFIDVSVTSTPESVGFYSVSYYLSVYDTASGAVNGVSGQINVQVPYALKDQKKRDTFIRNFLADVIENGFTTSGFPATGLIIDPDDIYIPFAAR